MLEDAVSLCADVPASFQAACVSIFGMTSTEGRAFICRGYVSKCLGTTTMLSPACFILGANRQADAEALALCISDILDHIGVQETAGTLERKGTLSILDVVSRRVLLLTPEEGMYALDDVGIPVMQHTHRDNLVVMPYVETVGFNADKIATFRARTPYL